MPFAPLSHNPITFFNNTGTHDPEAPAATPIYVRNAQPQRPQLY